MSRGVPDAPDLVKVDRRCGDHAVDEGAERDVPRALSRLKLAQFGLRAARRRGAAVVPRALHCTFDARRARELLGATPPPIEDYFASLMRYAREANWGKQPSSRWDVGLTQRAA